MVQPSAKREGFATVPDVTWNDVGALEAVREELSYAILVCTYFVKVQMSMLSTIQLLLAEKSKN